MAKLFNFWSILFLARTFLRYAGSQETGDVRLMNGGQSSRGRVEVYDGDVWTTVCDDYWDNADAVVVCRQLGYSTADALARYSSFYGKGTGYIWLDNVMCFGQEAKLVHCPRSRGPSNCRHSEDAGVDCAPKEGDVRLVNGLTRDEGRVEVYHESRWGSICDSRWNDQDAAVICRQVGFPSIHARAVYDAYFGRGTGRIALDGVRCSGTESDLLSCWLSPWYPTDCTHWDDAGVICGTYRGQVGSRSTSTSPMLASILSFVIMIVIVVIVVIIVRIRRRQDRSCESFSALRGLAQRIRNPVNIRSDGQSGGNRAPDTPPPEYPLTVQLNNNDQQPSYSQNVEPPIHVTNISLNVNFENQQILVYPPDGQVLSPPPYSPSDPEPGVATSGLVVSPPPYSASEEQFDYPPEGCLRGEQQLPSDQMQQGVTSHSSLDPLSSRRGSHFEESGATSAHINSRNNNPLNTHLYSFSRPHPLSFNTEPIVESSDDDDDDYILPPTPHRNSVVPVEDRTNLPNAERQNIPSTTPHGNSMISLETSHRNFADISIPPLVSHRNSMVLGDDYSIAPSTPHMGSIVPLDNRTIPPSTPHRNSLVPLEIPASPRSPRSDEEPPPYSPWNMSTFV